MLLLSSVMPPGATPSSPSLLCQNVMSILYLNVCGLLVGIGLPLINYALKSIVIIVITSTHYHNFINSCLLNIYLAPLQENYSEALINYML